MSRKLSLILGILVIIAGAVLFTALFTVNQKEQAIVLMFGDPKRVITEPGLQFKLPWVENVLYYEKRVLNLDPPVERVLLSDQKRLLVDAFARYRITDALAFYQAVRTEGGVRQRLGPIINAALRGVLGNFTLASVLSEERDEIMRQIQDQVNTQAGRFGIELVDVRIRRADLPDEISDQVYQRMRSEREREAAEFRARGFEQAQRIKGSAPRSSTTPMARTRTSSTSTAPCRPTRPRCPATAPIWCSRRTVSSSTSSTP
jgi:membrane protease subunit HflC